MRSVFHQWFAIWWVRCIFLSGCRFRATHSSIAVARETGIPPTTAGLCSFQSRYILRLTTLLVSLVSRVWRSNLPYRTQTSISAYPVTLRRLESLTRSAVLPPVDIIPCPSSFASPIQTSFSSGPSRTHPLSQVSLHRTTLYLIFLKTSVMFLQLRQARSGGGRLEIFDAWATPWPFISRFHPHQSAC